MESVITALQGDPHDPNRVHVYIDGKHALVVSLDLAASERMTVGQACPPDRLERLHAAQEIENIYASALNFLSYRPRSAREVELRLRKKSYTPEQIGAVMEKLRRIGLVDDLAFARYWIENRMSFSPRGPRLLRSELRQKGIAPTIIEQVLVERQDEQEQLLEPSLIETPEEDNDEVTPGTDLANALALAQKRMRSLSGLEPQVAKRRLFAFLTRRGYDYSIVGEVLRRVFSADESDDLEAE